MKFSITYIIFVITSATAVVAYPARLRDTISELQDPSSGGNSVASQPGSDSATNVPSTPTPSAVQSPSTPSQSSVDTPSATSSKDSVAPSGSASTSDSAQTSAVSPTPSPSSSDESSASSKSSFISTTTATPSITSEVSSSTSATSTPTDSGPTSSTAVTSATSTTAQESSTSASSSTVASPSTTSSAPTQSPTVNPQQYLDAHNLVREKFHANDLQWSNDLQAKAQLYAEKCQLQHTDGEFGAIGENLVAATGQFGAHAAVGTFIEDEDDFSAQDIVLSHFTQVVWKSTTQVGCGVALCDNLFPGRGVATYHACFYDPVGNVVGEEEANLDFDD